MALTRASGGGGPASPDLARGGPETRPGAGAGCAPRTRASPPPPQRPCGEALVGAPKSGVGFPSLGGPNVAGGSGARPAVALAAVPVAVGPGSGRARPASGSAPGRVAETTEAGVRATGKF